MRQDTRRFPLGNLTRTTRKMPSGRVPARLAPRSVKLRHNPADTLVSSGRAADLLGSRETLSLAMNDGLPKGSSTETVPADVLPGGDISPRSTTSSYVGQMQWFAAADDPPHLKAIVPLASPPGAFFNEPILNGCCLLPMGEWMLAMGRRSFQYSEFEELFSEPQPYFDALPLSSLPSRSGTECHWWDEMMRHPNLDDLWRACSYQDAWPTMSVAALNVTGWWDMNFPGAPDNFVGMRQQGKTAQIRDAQKMIIGPWPHWVNEKRALNRLDFGDEAIINLNHYLVRFYDCYLKGVRNGIENDPRVHVFVLGANEWWTSNDWPLPGTEPTRFYLHSKGHANSLKGDGGLSTELPVHEPADAYTYDPADPIGSFWNLRDGPVDDRVPSI
jgi:uncharacterized protein